jgi:hypothetical protein
MCESILWLSAGFKFTKLNINKRGSQLDQDG